MNNSGDGTSRRKLLKSSGAALASLAVLPGAWAFSKIQPIENPLKHYPYRSWEDLYRKDMNPCGCAM